VRVLIVDDNRSFADLLRAALDTVDGVECVGTASAAAEGFQRVAELAPSVVVMDIMMPGLDGLAATRKLREISPDTAVAVVSAHSEGEWIARAEDAGASAYIPKGGSLDEMIEVLRAACPGPMIVTRSLRPLWSSWQRPAAAPAVDQDQRPPGFRSRMRQAARELKTRVETGNRTRDPGVLDH
jgi:DNA-binding NarL/FixJ family response regulator